MSSTTETPPRAADEHLRRVAAAAIARTKADAEFREAILAANGAGHSTRGIAPHAGVSHQRVQQVIREEAHRAVRSAGKAS